MGTIKRILICGAALAVATVVWLPLLHLFFEPSADELASPERSARAQELLERQLSFWEPSAAQVQSEQTSAGFADWRGESLDRMRPNNPEWDFMARTYLVMSLGNLALESGEGAERERYVRAMDRILEDTLRLEEERGIDWFLMAYLRDGRFRSPVQRSIATDGEIAMMLAVRELVEPSERWAPVLEERVEHLEAHFDAGPVMSGESYPDECWTFCNTFGLAALRVADAAAGDDAHRELGDAWVRTAREHLVDPGTGMLVSSFTWDGRHRDGPEGSSIFMVAHNLMLVDEAVARDQFDRAKEHLSRDLLGFGWAREWPESWVGPADIDSGPVIPLTGASAGSSGLAILGAAAFDDREMLGRLLTSVDFAAFPVVDDTGLRYAAGNQAGDAVFLYALTHGPLVKTVQQRNDVARAGGVS